MHSMVNSQPELLIKSSGDEVEYGAWYQSRADRSSREATTTVALRPGTCLGHYSTKQSISSCLRVLMPHEELGVLCRAMSRWCCESSASTPASSYQKEQTKQTNSHLPDMAAANQSRNIIVISSTFQREQLMCVAETRKTRKSQTLGKFVLLANFWNVFKIFHQP